MRHDLFAFADVGRGGLGKMLLPWARCEIFRHQWHVPMLAPRWGSTKFAWLIQRGNDNRNYLGHFNKQGYVRGLPRLAVLLTAARVSEADFVPGAEDARGERRKTLVIFRGLGEMFAPLLPHRKLVRERLVAMLAPRVARQLAGQHTDFVIGAHVRRGEKPILPYGRPQTAGNQAMPDEWFIRCIQDLRKVLGFAAPVRVFSDARPGELRRLLALPNVSFSEDNSAIVDMLMLARSRILIASTHSTFSMWASYLGQMPSLWYPGGAPMLNPRHPGLETETDLAGHFSRDFAEVVEALNLALNP